MKKKIKIPRFKNEERERAFWSNIDISKFADKKDLESVAFPNLKPSSRSIAIRIPVPMLLRLKERANERNVPYQSLIKEYIDRELSQKR